MLDYVMFTALGFVAGVLAYRIVHNEEIVLTRRKIYNRGYIKGFDDAKELDEIFRDINI